MLRWRCKVHCSGGGRGDGGGGGGGGGGGDGGGGARCTRVKVVYGWPPHCTIVWMATLLHHCMDGHLTAPLYGCFACVGVCACMCEYVMGYIEQILQ